VGTTRLELDDNGLYISRRKVVPLTSLNGIFLNVGKLGFNFGSALEVEAYGDFMEETLL